MAGGAAPAGGAVVADRVTAGRQRATRSTAVAMVSAGKGSMPTTNGYGR